MSLNFSGACFFKDYSNLSTEEILDKIFNGEMEYSIFWTDEKSEEKFLEDVKRDRERGYTWAKSKETA